MFTLIAGLDRARRRSQGASTLGVLQVVAVSGRIRPSGIAKAQQVHPSLVTRQIRSLEDAGYVEVIADPDDNRSWLVRLTDAGSEEMHRLQQVGLERFATFVAEWSPDDVRTLTRLLRKLEASKAAVGERERDSRGVRSRTRHPE
jgi:DNA-binding MarR family transcriptional regulator